MRSKVGNRRKSTYYAYLRTYIHTVSINTFVIKLFTFRFKALKKVLRVDVYYSLVVCKPNTKSIIFWHTCETGEAARWAAAFAVNNMRFDVNNGFFGPHFSGRDYPFIFFKHFTEMMKIFLIELGEIFFFHFFVIIMVWKFLNIVFCVFWS